MTRIGFWILGDVFLRNLYTGRLFQSVIGVLRVNSFASEFDFGNLQVGFAPVILQD